MISPYRNLKPPYTLPSDIVYFHDWRYVYHGSVGWSEDGSRTPMSTTDPMPPMRYEPRLLPVGIRLCAQPAQKTAPFLEPQMDDEMLLFAGTVIRDEGRYRFWFECWPTEHIHDERYKIGNLNYVRYGESDDGENWTFPKLGLIERHGSADNNVVYGLSLTPETGYYYGSVFKDPSAPSEERYKMIYQGHLSEAMKEHYLRERPDDVDAINRGRSEWAGFFGAVSPDGLRWTPLEELLVAQYSDTHNMCEYDPVLEQYVAYCRNWFFSRRGIGRAVSDNFRRFPLSEEALWPDPTMDPDELWYANGKTKMPGTNDYHVMFPTRWSIRHDKFDIHLFTSPDNLIWHRVPGGPVCEVGDPGDWDGGVVAPGIGLVELPGGRMGVPLVGSKVPHKYPRKAPLGAIGWAWWPKGRLVALKADVEASFALQPLKIAQRHAILNCRTAPAGSVQVEVLGPAGEVLPGRTFADCDWIVGDHLERAITWKGEADLSHNGDGPITLCFKMRCAELYSVAFR